MILIKIGGSVLTNKGTAGRPRFNRRVALRLAREVRRIAAREPVVLVHGAGSWGHPLALQYGIGKTRLTGRRLQAAVVETQAAVRELRSEILAVCHAAGIMAVDIPAGAAAFARGKDLYFDAALFQHYTQRGLVPVTGGDVIIDDRLGARILSGDEILRHLAKALKPDRVVFASDVEGLRNNGKTVRRLTPLAAEALLPKVARGRDATGGMRAKIEHAVAIASGGSTVIIIDGGVPGRLESAARGRKVPGTRIQR